jgi:hypothetical protein
MHFRRERSQHRALWHRETQTQSIAYITVVDVPSDSTTRGRTSAAASCSRRKTRLRRKGADHTAAFASPCAALEVHAPASSHTGGSAEKPSSSTRTARLRQTRGARGG